jgi:hypothetical protein
MGPMAYDDMAGAEGHSVGDNATALSLFAPSCCRPNVREREVNASSGAGSGCSVCGLHSIGECLVRLLGYLNRPEGTGQPELYCR